MLTIGTEPSVLWMWVEAGESFFPTAWPGQAQAQRVFCLTDPLSLKGEIFCSFVCPSVPCCVPDQIPIGLGLVPGFKYALHCKKLADLHACQ